MRGADAALDHAPFAIDEFEFGETQQEADMIETFACRATELLAAFLCLTPQSTAEPGRGLINAQP